MKMQNFSSECSNIQSGGDSISYGVSSLSNVRVAASGSQSSKVGGGGKPASIFHLAKTETSESPNKRRPLEQRAVGGVPNSSSMGHGKSPGKTGS